MANVISKLFSDLRARREKQQKSSLQEYVEIRTRLDQGVNVPVDEIDRVLNANGFDPEKLEGELSILDQIRSCEKQVSGYENDLRRREDLLKQADKLTAEMDAIKNRLTPLRDEALTLDKTVPITVVQSQILELRQRLTGANSQ